MDPNAVTLEELRTLCDNILNLSSTTIDAMQPVSKSMKSPPSHSFVPPTYILPHRSHNINSYFCGAAAHPPRSTTRQSIIYNETIPSVTTDFPQVLWPYLLEAVVNTKYTSSIGTIAKAISHIGAVKRDTEASDYYIDFDRAVNLPKPQAIIARLMVIVNAPLRRGQIGMMTSYTYLMTSSLDVKYSSDDIGVMS